MNVLTILEQINEKKLKLSQGSVKILQKMANYQEPGVTLTKTQLNKLKSTATTGTSLRISKNNFHELAS